MSTVASAPILEAYALRKIYRTGEVEVQALRGVDLKLATGELIVLLGASGSGKSTLLNIKDARSHPTFNGFQLRRFRVSDWTGIA